MIIWSPRAPSIILLNFALSMKSSPLALLAPNTSLASPILPICLPNLSLLPHFANTPLVLVSLYLGSKYDNKLFP